MENVCFCNMGTSLKPAGVQGKDSRTRPEEAILGKGQHPYSRWTSFHLASNKLLVALKAAPGTHVLHLPVLPTSGSQGYFPGWSHGCEVPGSSLRRTCLCRRPVLLCEKTKGLSFLLVWLLGGDGFGPGESIPWHPPAEGEAGRGMGGTARQSRQDSLRAPGLAWPPRSLARRWVFSESLKPYA